MRQNYLYIVFCFVTYPALSAQDLPWQSLVHEEASFPYHQDPPAVVPDPGDPTGRSWYAFTPGYVWHTADMGVTMRVVSETGRDNQINSSFAVAHGNPDILYLATGLSNFGSSFETGPFEAMRFEGNGIYRSADRGETWRRLPFFMNVGHGPDLYILNSLATSAQGDTVVVTTRRRILRSTDHGQTWEVVVNELPDTHPEEPLWMTQIYHHPWSMRHLFVTAHGGTLPAWTSHLYVLASHDGGSSWDYLKVDDHPPNLSPLSPRPDNHGTWDFAADPKDPNIFWVQVYRKLYRDLGEHPRKIFRTDDGGQTWIEVPVVKHERLREGWSWAGNNTRAKSIHVHPTNSDTLMLGWSFNHYRNGQLMSRGQQTNVRIYFFNEYPDAYRGYRAVTEPFSGHQRHDRVAYTWNISWVVNDFGAVRSFSSGILPRHLYIADVCTTPIPGGVDPAHRYVASSYVRSSNTIGLHKGWRLQRSNKKRQSLSTASHHDGTPVPGQSGPVIAEINPWAENIQRLYCHPHRYDIVRAGLTSPPYKGRWFSENTRLHTHPDTTLDRLPDVYTSLSFSRKQPDRIWRATGYKFTVTDDYMAEGSRIDLNLRVESVHAHDADPDVVYTEVGVTKDGGQTWDLHTFAEDIQIKPYDRMVSHPTNPAVIYSCSAKKGLREWGNYMTVHRLIASLSDYGPCRDLMIFPHSPDRMWMGTDTGLWETWDRGKSWTRQNRGLPNLPIVRVYLAHDGKEILVSVFGRGLFTVPSTEVDVMLVSSDPVIEFPESNALLTNYPNPFTRETTLQFSVEQASQVRLDVYDVLGRRVSTAVDRLYGRGVHQLRWDGSAMPGGVYFVRMQVDGQDRGVQKVVRR